MSWLLYGANGYTGELIARAAAARGLAPVLAGRGALPLERLAAALGLTRRVFGLEDAAVLDRALEGVSAVLHCAGPFSRTARPMAAACLRQGVHYLDITGEAPVFEELAAQGVAARARGVMLLPGSGFDVVPSDCLAAHLKRRLPTATRLALAFQPSRGISRGTALTLIENVHRGGLVRRDGVLARVPPGYRTRRIDFGRGPRPAITIPWGDVSTAFHSTGIPGVEVYLAAPASLRWGIRATRLLGPVLGSGPVQRLLRRRVLERRPGPDADERARGRCLLWGEAADTLERVAVSRLRTPEGYELTCLTALALVERVLAGDVHPGFQTPSRAYGPDFILAIPGVERSDEPMRSGPFME